MTPNYLYGKISRFAKSEKGNQKNAKKPAKHE